MSDAPKTREDVYYYVQGANGLAYMTRSVGLRDEVLETWYRKDLAERMVQEAVAAALMEAAALAESAMRCRSCGGVFAVKNPHTDETCPKGRADWDNAEPDEVADAILALIPADALARLEARDARVREAAIRGLRGYLGNLTYDAARIDDYLAGLTGGKDA